jgi:hypothetical protein
LKEGHAEEGKSDDGRADNNSDESGAKHDQYESRSLQGERTTTVARGRLRHA